MRYASVCSGIEAPSVAWSKLGWNPIFFSDVDPFCCALLKQHYPDVPNRGDMTKFSEWPDATIDLLIGGTPCQSFSVAGLRGGLADARGNLMLTFLEIAARYRPRWLVWENVAGVLSVDGGRAFGALLGGMGQLGYGFAYRIFDAQYVRTRWLRRAVPQRRRRVFVVGYLGDWRAAAAVLFDRESLSGNPPPRREAGQSVAALTANGVGTCGADDNQAQGGHLVAYTLKAEGHDASEDGTGCGVPLVADVCPTLRAGANQTGGDRPPGTDVDTVESLVIAPICFDETNITSAHNRSNPQPNDPSHTLQSNARPPAIVFDCKASGQNGFGVGEVAPTMRAMNHNRSHANAGGQVAVAIPIIGDADRSNSEAVTPSPDAKGKVRLRDPGLGVGQDGDPMFTLQATKPHAVAVSLRGRDGGATAELGDDVGNALRASGGGGDKAHVLTQMQVRRLTPRECERLMGIPDDYTLIDYRGKPAKDGPRYRAIGNSIAVNQLQWIGERIEMVDATQKGQI